MNREEEQRIVGVAGIATLIVSFLFGSFIATNVVNSLGSVPIKPATVFSVRPAAGLGECTTELAVSIANGGDGRGKSVSIFGNRVVAGAPGVDEAAGNNVGAAYVSLQNGSSWVEEQRLVASDAVAYDEFGWAVAIDGDVLVVGAPGVDDGAKSSVGAAYVFRHNGTSWIQEEKLFAPDRSALDLFGRAVAISGDTIIVGAPNKGFGTGAAYLYRFNGTTWIQDQKITASDFASGDRFADAVAIDGNRVLVGAQLNRDAGPETGAAYVFSYDGASWFEEQKLLPADAAPYSSFGFSVSLDDDVALIGAFSDGTAGINFGSAYVFRFNGSEWAEEAELLGSGSSINGGFGFAVAVSGDLAVIGATRPLPSTTGEEAVYLFYKEAGGWNEVQRLVPDEAVGRGLLGGAVAATLGNVVIGSATRTLNTALYQSGAAYVLNLDCLFPPIFSLTNLTAAPPSFSPRLGQSTTISYTLSRDALVSIFIYNSAGERIRTLAGNWWQSNGTPKILWDGKRAAGVREPEPPGVYTYRIYATDAITGQPADPYPASGTVVIQAGTSGGGLIDLEGAESQSQVLPSPF